MWAITSTDALDYFEDQDSFVSVLLTDRYEAAAIQILADHFYSFNEELGANWHLLLPYKGSSQKLQSKITQRAVYPSDFDEMLAVKIAEKLEVKQSNFPCIVFDLKTEIVIFRIPAKNSDLKILFTSLSNAISEFWFENNNSDRARHDFMKFLKRDILKKYLVVRVRNPKNVVKLVPYIKNVVEFLL